MILVVPQHDCICKIQLHVNFNVLPPALQPTIQLLVLEEEDEGECGGNKSTLKSCTDATATATATLRENIKYTVTKEIQFYRNSQDQPLVEEYDEINDKVIKYSNPLFWWRNHELDYPLLARVARRVLAIPATSAEPSRLYTSIGQDLLNDRSRMLSSYAENMLFLNTNFEVCNEYITKQQEVGKREN